jgi:competence protein ComEC
MEERTKKLIAYLLLPLIVAAAFVINNSFKSGPDYKLHVDFYDVGQGDAMFVQSYLGNQMLIDGGPTSGVLSALGRDMPFFDRTIDVVMLSHPHEDHVNGLIDVLKKYTVNLVIMPDAEFDSPAFAEFLKLIDEKRIEKVYAHEGMRIYLDPATVFDVYYPPAKHLVLKNGEKGLEGPRLDPNDASIVGKLSFGKTKFFFEGDAGFEVENLILPKYNLDSDVLKVGHHGSQYSSSQDFVDEVSPQYSVIEVGQGNTYGHPTQEAMDRIKSAGSQIFRTDLDHTVEFVSDGMQIVRE